MISQVETVETENLREPVIIPPYVTYLTTFVKYANRFLIPFYIYSMCVELPHGQLYALRGAVVLMCLMFQGLVVVLNKQGEVFTECKKKHQIIFIFVVLWVLSPLFSAVSLLDGNFVIAVVLIANCICLTIVFLWIFQNPLRQTSNTNGGCSDFEMIAFLLIGMVLFAYGIFKAHNILKIEALQKLQNSTFNQ